MKLIVVVGATATGKSDLAFQLAQNLNCEIVNFDSVQIFKKLDIGSAKPPAEYTQKIKHHLLDWLEPQDGFTAGDYRRSSLKVLSELSLKHKFCVLVGGTGFYLKALIHGMYEVPTISESVRQQLLVEGESNLQALYKEMISRDPELEGKIHANDQYRILRSLELMRTLDKPLSEIKSKFKPKAFPYSVAQVGLKREKIKLKESIFLRSKKMVQEGLIEEAQNIKKQYGDLRVLHSVGYKETLSFLDGQIKTKDELSEQISNSTLKLAKRQSTWFRADPKTVWYDADKKEEVLKIPTEVMAALDKTP